MPSHSCDSAGCCQRGTLTVRVSGRTLRLCWKHARDARAGGSRPTLEERGRRFRTCAELREHD